MFLSEQGKQIRTTLTGCSDLFYFVLFMVETHDDYSTEENNDRISARLVAATQEENSSQGPGRCVFRNSRDRNWRERTFGEELGDDGNLY